MAWSNKAERTKITAEKSHSLSFVVRVEDRLHKNIIQESDKCLFTVRPASYLVGFNDMDITVGTDSTMGNGVRADAVKSGTGEDRVFLFEIQAAAMNLNPETEYFYDITYIRDGFSMSVSAGGFDVMENVTNRSIAENFVSVGGAWMTVATLQNGTVLNVTSSMPMPTQGPPGTGAYTIARPLAAAVGSSVVIPVADIAAPAGRTVQIGDVIFSSITVGVLATVQSISTTGTPSATLMTRQVYGRETLKALLDTQLHIVPLSGATLETIDFAWACPKSQVPLPSGYEYRVGDMLFSHSAIAGSAATKKLLISLVESITTTDLNVRTKVVFPMFLDTDDIEVLLEDLVPESRTINGKTLDTDLVFTQDNFADGVSAKRFTAGEQAKLAALPTAASLTTSFNGKANSSHSHTIADVASLSSTLADKVDSTSVDIVWVGTQAAYNAISTKSDRTLYIIKG